jgi:hypothetical protein
MFFEGMEMDYYEYVDLMIDRAMTAAFEDGWPALDEDEDEDE